MKFYGESYARLPSCFQEEVNWVERYAQGSDRSDHHSLNRSDHHSLKLIRFPLLSCQRIFNSVR